MDPRNCGEINRIPIFFDSEEPIPCDFIAHAQLCQDCLFSLSHALASQEAYLITDRYKSTQCPDSGSFMNIMLLSSIKAIYTLLGAGANDSQKRAMKRFNACLIEDAVRYISLQNHISMCALCNFYYETIFDCMLAAQKRYEEAILLGEVVAPHGECIAREFIVPGDSIAPMPDNSKEN